MSSINIEIVDVTVESVARPSGKGSYEKATVTYKNSEGKIESKAIMDWASKAVWPTIVSAKKGDCFNIEREKDGAYWNWVGISKQDSAVVKEPYKAPVKPTYETPEERAQRQVYIIRQSSISAAVNLLGPKAKVEDVISTADKFVSYVMQTGMEFIADDPV